MPPAPALQPWLYISLRPVTASILAGVADRSRPVINAAMVSGPPPDRRDTGGCSIACAKADPTHTAVSGANRTLPASRTAIQAAASRSCALGLISMQWLNGKKSSGSKSSTEPPNKRGRGGQQILNGTEATVARMEPPPEHAEGAAQRCDHPPDLSARHDTSAQVTPTLPYAGTT